MTERVSRFWLTLTLDTVYKTWLSCATWSSGWGLGGIDAPEATFGWPTLEAAGGWWTGPHEQPVDFRAFNDEGDHEGRTALVLGAMPGLAYFGFCGQRRYFGGSLDRDALDNLIKMLLDNRPAQSEEGYDSE